VDSCQFQFQVLTVPHHTTKLIDRRGSREIPSRDGRLMPPSWPPRDRLVGRVRSVPCQPVQASDTERSDEVVLPAVVLTVSGQDRATESHKKTNLAECP
jgi:hypothetical protein